MASEDKANPCGHVEFYLKEEANVNVTPGGNGDWNLEHKP